MTRQAPRPWEEAYRRQGRLWRGSRLDGWTAAFLERHPDAAAGRWFDAGCGDGKGLAPLARDVTPRHLFGGDRSHWGLRLAREQADSVRGHLVRSDARAWPFPDSTFDVVRAVHLIGHLPAAARQAAVLETGRILRPEGVLLVSEFGTGDFRRGQGEEVEPSSYRRGHGIVTHYFDRDELVALVTAAGLVVESCEAERFVVRYGGVERPRERWGVVARKAHPGV